MIHLVKKHLKASVVSLVALAISLPMYLFAAVAPTVTILGPINAGPGPNSVAIAQDGKLVVGNYAGGEINLLEPTGKFIKTINKEKIYSNAIGLAQDGTILAATSKTVTRLSADGIVIGQLPYAFMNSTSFATDDLGYIYVLDSVASKIIVFTPDYQYSASFSSKGSAPGQLYNPQNLVFDKVNRQLWVADDLNNRVDIFDLNGNFVKSFGTAAAQMGREILPMEFHSPRAVALEYTDVAPYQVNRIYVADSMQALIQVIDGATFTPLLFPGKTNNFINGPMLPDLRVPAHLVFDQVNKRLLVPNQLGLSVFGIDGGGNPLDTTPPTVTVNPIPATSSVATVNVTGTVEEGSVVTVSNATVEMTSAITWKALVTLAAGSNSISVTAKDAAGNTTSPQVVTVSYILPAPVVTVAALPVITNNANLQISGTVDAGASVSVKNNATSAVVEAVVSGTTWSSSLVLAEGVNTFSVIANAPNSDTAVVESTTTLDSIAPKLTVSALSNNSVTSAQVQNISGTVADAGQVAILVNNSPVTVTDGAFSTAVTLTEGANQIFVIAGDAAGNTVQDVRTINFDGTKPVITLAATTLPDNTTTTSDIYTISGNVSEAAQVTVAGNQVVLDSANSWATTLNLVPGDNTIEVVATDVVGNSSSVKRTVTYSVAKLDLAIQEPAQDLRIVKNDEVRFEGTINDPSATVSYKVNNRFAKAIKVKNGKFKFEVEFNREGTYSVAVTAKDASGVSTTAVRTVIYKKKDHRVDNHR